VKAPFEEFSQSDGKLDGSFRPRHRAVVARGLLRLSLICTFVGLTAIYVLSLQVEPHGISINMLDRYVGDVVRISGVITSMRIHDEGHLFLRVRDESGECQVPIFSDMASRLPRVFVGERMRVTGYVEEYRGSLQIVPRIDRDVELMGPDISDIVSAVRRIGEVVVLRGIALRPSRSGEDFVLADETGSIGIRTGCKYPLRWLANVTVSGRMKTSGGHPYLDMSDLIEAHPADLPSVDLCRKERFQGLGKVSGRVKFNRSSAVLEAPCGALPLGRARGLSLADGDLVTAVVRGRGGGLDVIEVEVEKAGILPIRQISEEMLGKRVRVSGVVIRKFVSGKNVFLTLYNETDLDVPVFGGGGDVNIALGDLLTVVGTVKKYRDRLQVVPNSLSDLSVEPGEVVDRDIDQISDADLYQLVRIRGRVTSVKHYRRSCSIWVRGAAERIRVYAPFDVSNISVGTEVEVVGLVKRFNGQLELIPRAPSDVG